ncbi:unnamed protein product [Chironomus riparius]|uniref:glutathione transferase n=1 Tax=Chironomus riparius TaxID=315576 RepID=A0A9N9WIZ3_9DIPT|nr:unnamed protein product [Chironomus riparius]
MSAKLTLYYFVGSMPSRACVILSKVLNIPIELRSINLYEREQHSEWYKKLNPAKKVPVLIDGDFILTESRAILAYLVDTRHPGNSLYPKDEKKRAAIDERLHFDGSSVFPKISNVFQSRVMGKSETECKKTFRELTAVVKTLEEFLSKSEYFAGNGMTIADISIFPNVTASLEFLHFRI